MNTNTKNILLWVSIGVVGTILGRAFFMTIRKKGTITDGNTKLNAEMEDLILRIKNEPK